MIELVGYSDFVRLIGIKIKKFGYLSTVITKVKRNQKLSYVIIF